MTREIIEAVRTIEREKGIDGDTLRIVERGVAETRGSIAGYGGDRSRGREPANPMIAAVGDVEVAVRIRRQAGGLIQTGARAGLPNTVAMTFSAMARGV